MLLYRNATDFVYILFSCKLTELVYQVSLCVCVNSLGFSTESSCYLQIGIILLIFYNLDVFIFSSCRDVPVGTSSAVLNRCHKKKYFFYFSPDLSERAFSLVLQWDMFSVGFFIGSPFIRLKAVSPHLSVLSVFPMKSRWMLSGVQSLHVRASSPFFLLYSVNVMPDSGWFLCWTYLAFPKSHLVTGY